MAAYWQNRSICGFGGIIFFYPPSLVKPGMEYFYSILSVIASIVGYYLLSPFIDHTESIFFLATIAISARGEPNPV